VTNCRAVDGTHACKTSGSMMVQVESVRQKAEEFETGESSLSMVMKHAAKLHENGTYSLSPKLRHVSKMEQAMNKLRLRDDVPAAMQDVFSAHNLYRCMHGVPLATWDSAIAQSAQAWADEGHWGHSSSASRKLPGIGQVGENIAWGYPTRSGRDSVVAWYSEIEYTRGGTPSSCSDSTDPNEAICHYTQVVWKGSTKIGCGKGTAKVNNLDGDFWVCQYAEAGNMGGQFTNNVVAPQKTEDDCTGAEPLPTPPTPAPPPPSGCQEPGKDDPTHIYVSGERAECADISWACSYSFVKKKCICTCP